MKFAPDFLGKKARNSLRHRAFIRPMNADDRDELWTLLGRAPPTKVSPFFSRNVLRAARAQADPPPGFFTALRRQWQFAAVAVAASALLIASVAHLGERPRPSAVLAQQINNLGDYEVIEDLDVLLASERSAAWLDPSISTF